MISKFGHGAINFDPVQEHAIMYVMAQGDELSSGGYDHDPGLTRGAASLPKERQVLYLIEEL